MSAYDWLSHAYYLDPCLPDVRYHLGSLHLEWDKPLAALDLMWCAPTSNQEVEWSQDLAIGSAFGQLNLLEEACSYYSMVAGTAAGTKLAQLASQYQDELDESLLGTPAELFVAGEKTDITFPLREGGELVVETVEG